MRDFAAGDEVYGLTGGVGGLPGSLAEYAAVDPALLAGRGRAHHGEILREAAALADAGTLRPVVDARRFTRRTVAQAHHAVEDGTAASKIVIDIAE